MRPGLGENQPVSVIVDTYGGRAARRRRVLRQGPDEGRPLGLLHGALHRQERRGRRPRRGVHGPARLRHRRGRALVVYFDTHGTGQADEARIEAVVRKLFPMTPKGIIETLKLRRPIYRQTAAYGHFGRTEKGFEWERTDKADALREEVLGRREGEKGPRRRLTSSRTKAPPGDSRRGFFSAFETANVGAALFC